MRKINLLILVTVLGNKVYASSSIPTISSLCGFATRWPDALEHKCAAEIRFIAMPDIPLIRFSIDFFMDLSVDAAVMRIPLIYINNPSFMEYLKENNLLVDSPFSEPVLITRSVGNTLYRLRDNTYKEIIIANNDPVSIYVGDSVMEILLLRNREMTDTNARTIEMLVNCLNEYEEGDNLVMTLRSGGFLGTGETPSGEIIKTSVEDNISDNTNQGANNGTDKKELIRMLISILGKDTTQQDLLNELESQGLLDESMITAVGEIFNERNSIEKDEEETEGNNDKISTTTPAIVLEENNIIGSELLNEPVIVTVEKDDEEVEENYEDDAGGNNGEIFIRRTETIVENDVVNNDNHGNSFLGNIFSGIGSTFHRITDWFLNRNEENSDTEGKTNLKEKEK